MLWYMPCPTGQVIIDAHLRLPLLTTVQLRFRLRVLDDRMLQKVVFYCYVNYTCILGQDLLICGLVLLCSPMILIMPATCRFNQQTLS